MIDFDFPPLGATGEGDPVYPPGKNKDTVDRRHDSLYWSSGDTRQWEYYVTYQFDRPACAFRCHYPGGSSPCDQATADRFVQWVQDKERRVRDKERNDDLVRYHGGDPDAVYP